VALKAQRERENIGNVLGYAELKNGLKKFPLQNSAFKSLGGVEKEERF
jgi:hypothetical protein